MGWELQGMDIDEEEEDAEADNEEAEAEEEEEAEVYLSKKILNLYSCSLLKHGHCWKRGMMLRENEVELL